MEVDGRIWESRCSLERRDRRHWPGGQLSGGHVVECMGVSPRSLADQKGRAQGSWMGAGTAVTGLSLEDVFFTHGRSHGSVDPNVQTSPELEGARSSQGGWFQRLTEALCMRGL